MLVVLPGACILDYLNARLGVIAKSAVPVVIAEVIKERLLEYSPRVSCYRLLPVAVGAEGEVPLVHAEDKEDPVRVVADSEPLLQEYLRRNVVNVAVSVFGVVVYRHYVNSELMFLREFTAELV